MQKTLYVEVLSLKLVKGVEEVKAQNGTSSSLSLLFNAELMIRYVSSAGDCY